MNFNTNTFPVPLLCPNCLRMDAGAAILSTQQTENVVAIADFCSRCGTEYPCIEGIHCLPPDLAAFRRDQAFAMEPDWLPQHAEELERTLQAAPEIEPDSALFRETLLPAIYGLTHFPESATEPVLHRELAGNPATIAALIEWLAHHPLPAGTEARSALEVGCGGGRMSHALSSSLSGGVIGLDLRLSMLRVAQRLFQQGEVWLPFRVEGRRFEPLRIIAPSTSSGPLHFVQADVTTLPFAPETFPLIVSMSLIDVVPDPLQMLRDLDALLAPGGLLLLATPYHWQPHTTPPKNWWSTVESTGPSTLRIALQGGHPALPHLHYEILETAADLPWALPGHRRFVYRYFLDALLARKRL